MGLFSKLKPSGKHKKEKSKDADGKTVKVRAARAEHHTDNSCVVGATECLSE